MKFDILTLFPEMFVSPFATSIIRRALESEAVTIRCHQIRDYALDRHRTTDDAPYGGGAGMVMKVEPLAACIEAVRCDRPQARVILMTPRGRPFDQETAARLAAEEELIIICGRYEGVDERVTELFVHEELSLGDFVLTGGEIAAMAVVDAVTRLLPGVLGSDASAGDDSFGDGLLEYPQYTRPPEFRGLQVPEVLLSGNHREIERWRRNRALEKTLAVRPELLRTAALTGAERDRLQQGTGDDPR
jgi:tRNA (guanine37-N1)-methyltransferase